MNEFVSEITTGLSANAIWGQITPLAGMIVTLTLVGITVYVVSKNLRRTRKLNGGTVK